MRRTMIVLIVALLLAAAVFGGAQAASQDYYRWTAVSNVQCTPYFSFDGSWESQGVDANAAVQVIQGLNGSYSSTSWLPFSSSSGAATYGGFAPPLPYTYEITYVTAVSGIPVYESYLLIDCDVSGVGTTTLTNTDLTVTSTSAATGPGPDMVALPEDAVVGTFVVNTELLWMADGSAVSEYVMAAGQSLWVVGMDETGMYYKVLLSGQPFWVPVASIGPTFGNVWDGTPLPTTVVD